MRAISIAFHDIVDDAYPTQRSAMAPNRVYALSRGRFRECLDAIGMRAGSPVVRTIEHDPGAFTSIPVFLTFDDGASSAYTCVADELERHGWRGHFFVITDRIGWPDSLDGRQIRELHQRGHVIGSHSCSHPERMSELTWNELLREWSASCQRLSGILGQRVTVASVANGYYSRKVGESAVAAGIDVLFTSEPTAVVSVLEGCLILGRYSACRFTSAAEVGSIAAGAAWPRFQQSALWLAKEPVKRVTGHWYGDIRARIIARLPQH